MTTADPTSLTRELGSRDEAAAGAAQDTLVRLGPAAVPALCSLAATGAGDSCWRAAYALGRIGDPRAVPVLCSILTEPRLPALVESAIQPFSQQPRRSGKQLGRRRREAAAALGKIRAPEAVPALCRALADPRPDVAISAQWALTAVGRPALPRLCQLLYQGNRSVRELAAGALGAIADPRAIEPLSHALECNDRPVRVAAARALRKIAAAHPTPELRQAVPALRRLLSPWAPYSVANHEGRLALRTSLEVIEAATRSMKDLPLPATHTLSLESLPVVADGTGALVTASKDGDGDPS